MKTSFIFYTDYMEQMELLTMEERGILITAIIKYVSTGEIIEMDRPVEIAFRSIKSQLDRDARKYDDVCEKRREAGKKGGLAKASNAKQKVANVASAKFAKQNLAKPSKAKQSLANLAEDDDEDESEDVDEDEDEDETKESNPLNNTYIDTQAGLGVTLYSAKDQGGSE